MRRPLAVAGVSAAGGAILAWVARLPGEQALLTIFSAGVFAQVAGIWWEERVLARRTRGIPAGLFKLIGAEGEVAASCAPCGRVRIGLETWEARCGPREVVAAGQRVVVLGVEGTTLVVEPSPR